MKHLKETITLMLIGIGTAFAPPAAAQWKGKPTDFSHGQIVVSANQRFLQYEDGTPFFYLGDTAWELFHRLNKQEADEYLTDRASKGYTVIQAVALAELDGHSVPNAYGHRPLTDFDPARPAVADGADNDYWDHVDYIINKANQLGMYVGLLPTWGRYWHDDRPLFNEKNAKSYGQFLGKRYKDKRIIWILGGDRYIDREQQKNIIRAMAKGIEEGNGGKQLITFHPNGGSGSSQWFHNEAWLDFNMRQNGHNRDYRHTYAKTLEDYRRNPAKPVIDGEPLYEDHPISFNPEENGHSVASDVRRAFYWDVFNGACGHTYGHHSIWQMYDPEKKRNPINRPLMSWKEALSQPGSGQMAYGRLLIESRPFATRIPMPEAIIPHQSATAVPGAGHYWFAATGDEAGTYLMVYAPVGRAFTVDTGIIKGAKIKAWWYNPRNGEAKAIGTFSNEGKKEFIPPTAGETLDWILVLDDASKKYPKPGKRITNKF